MVDQVGTTKRPRPRIGAREKFRLSCSSEWSAASSSSSHAQPSRCPSHPPRLRESAASGSTWRNASTWRSPIPSPCRSLQHSLHCHPSRPVHANLLHFTSLLPDCGRSLCFITAIPYITLPDRRHPPGLQRHHALLYAALLCRRGCSAHSRCQQ